MFLIIGGVLTIIGAFMRKFLYAIAFLNVFWLKRDFIKKKNRKKIDNLSYYFLGIGIPLMLIDLIMAIVAGG